MKKPILFAFIMVVLDQLTKFMVDKFISCGSSINVISFLNFFNISKIKNSGMILGLLEGENSFFIFAIFLFLTVISVWLYRYNNKIPKTQKYVLCLIIAGGLGNLIDRLFHHAVIDFLDFGINSLRYPAFNIADSCICVSILIIYIDFIFMHNNKTKA